MSIGYKYFQVVDSNTGTKYSVGLLDQVTMYSTGNASQPNDGTLKVGSTYNIAGAAVFIATGGNVVRAVTGSGGGLTFEFREETTPSTNVGGYYINGTKVCAWTSGLGGTYIVYLFKEYSSGRYNACRVISGQGANALFYNGVCLDGSTLTPDANQEGWSRMTKGDFKSNGNVILHVNNGTGAPGGRYSPFTLAAGTTSVYGPYDITAKDADVDNPYAGSGGTSPGGGDSNKQNWDPSSDIVGVDPLPDETTFGAQASGVVTIFVPSDSQLRSLANLLFSSDFFSYFVKELTGISDLFISLGMVPFNISGTAARITFLDYAQVVTPGVVGAVTLDKAPKQFFEFDMGSINMATDARVFRSDSCLDYSPYCRLGIFLPFIGYQELNIDECRESSIHLIYRIDILSGSCIALIYINDRCIYQFSGNCLTQLPITSADAGSVITNAVNVGLAAASAGATAAVASAGDALTAERLAGEKLTAAGAELQNAQHASMVANSEGSLSSATANGVMGMKPNFKKTGAVGASNSMIGVMQPYLFLETPNVAVPERYEKYCGLPSNITTTLGSLSGYAVVEDIRLNNLVALSPEVEEIYNLLKTGIIV